MRLWRKAAKRDGKKGEQKDKSGKENEKPGKEKKAEHSIRVGNLELTRDSKRSDLDKAWKALKPDRIEIEKLKLWRDEKILMGENWHGRPPMLDRAEKSVDDLARELTGGKMISVAAMKLDAALRRYEQIEAWRQRQAERKDAANMRGDVFLSADALAVMREHGNYYLYCMEQWDRTVDLNPERQRIEKVHIKEEHHRLQPGVIETIRTKQQKLEQTSNQIKDKLRPGNFLPKETAAKVDEILNRSRLSSSIQDSQQTKQTPGADMVTQGNSWRRVFEHLDAIDTTHSVKASEKNKGDTTNDNQRTAGEQNPEADKPKQQIQRQFPEKSEQSREESAKPPRPRDHKGRLM